MTNDERVHGSQVHRVLPKEGVCCDCGYSGEERIPCTNREEGVHCEHWMIASLQAEQKGLRRQYAEVEAKLDTYRTKCPTCRCRILPGEECRCCGDRAETEIEPPI